VLKTPPLVYTGAIFEGPYSSWSHRLALWRIWDLSRPPIVFIMLNPSTAGAKDNDPTLRKVLGFALRLSTGRKTMQDPLGQLPSFGGAIVVNMFSLCSTKPEGLRKHSSPELAINRQYVREALSVNDGRVGVCAWGGDVEHHLAHAREFEDFLRFESNAPLKCLGRTALGHPRHPLMLSYSCQLQGF